jgi:lysosomal alpha-mannosidase
MKHLEIYALAIASTLAAIVCFIIFYHPETECSISHPNSGKPLMIHVVPHTHDDVGWRSTIDEYYNERVHAIITSVIECLLEDPKRKFSYVEMKYLAMWLERQSDKTKDMARQLVHNG